MKETVTGAERELARKGSTEQGRLLYELQLEKFENNNKITEVGNQIWRLKCQNVALGQRNAKIEKEINNIFIKLGYKLVKDETENKED